MFDEWELVKSRFYAVLSILWMMFQFVLQALNIMDIARLTMLGNILNISLCLFICFLAEIRYRRIKLILSNPYYRGNYQWLKNSSKKL